MVSWQRFCVVESSANIQRLVKFKDEFCLFEPRKFKWMQIIKRIRYVLEKVNNIHYKNIHSNNDILPLIN